MKKRPASKPKNDTHSDRPFKLRLYVPDNPEVRSITWQRTTDMHGTIERDPEATWDQVERALAAGCYYVDDDDGSLCAYEEGVGFLAVIDPFYPDEDDEISVGHCDDAFVLGDKAKDQEELPG